MSFSTWSNCHREEVWLTEQMDDNEEVAVYVGDEREMYR